MDKFFNELLPCAGDNFVTFENTNSNMFFEAPRDNGNIDWLEIISQRAQLIFVETEHLIKLNKENQ